ncbi:MAG: hypothetical protein CM15mP75_0070 [Flammeovirgaceae bacterium]|nr:MAG: hypothetical protein CM15mP75_0070 [Flammeovirgaceae bacterium]
MRYRIPDRKFRHRWRSPIDRGQRLRSRIHSGPLRKPTGVPSISLNIRRPSKRSAGKFTTASVRMSSGSTGRPALARPGSNRTGLTIEGGQVVTTGTCAEPLDIEPETRVGFGARRRQRILRRLSRCNLFPAGCRMSTQKASLRSRRAWHRWGIRRLHRHVDARLGHLDRTRHRRTASLVRTILDTNDLKRLWSWAMCRLPPTMRKHRTVCVTSRRISTSQNGSVPRSFASCCSARPIFPMRSVRRTKPRSGEHHARPTDPLGDAFCETVEKASTWCAAWIAKTSALRSSRRTCSPAVTIAGRARCINVAPHIVNFYSQNVTSIPMGRIPSIAPCRPTSLLTWPSTMHQVFQSHL